MREIVKECSSNVVASMVIPWLLRPCLLGFQALYSVIYSALSCQRPNLSLARLICGSFPRVCLRGPPASSSDDLWTKTGQILRDVRWQGSNYQPE